MMELKIASRSLTDEAGKLRRLHYFLLVDELEAGSFFCEQYGVKIAEEDGDCAQIRGITTSAVRIDELMTTLVEQQVSPTVLEDVVQAESVLDIDGLVAKALEGETWVRVKP